MKTDNQDGKLTVAEIIKGGANIDNIILKSYNSENSQLMADMILYDFKPQSPVVDSMRTALFDLPEVDESVWNELSVWNRCFNKRIKTGKINVTPGKIGLQIQIYITKRQKFSACNNLSVNW